MSSTARRRGPVSERMARATARLTEQYGVREPQAEPALRALEAKLEAGETDLASLLAPVLNHHTWFLRDRVQLEGLAASLRARGGGPYLVWCAGCSTGEEAYSVALVAAMHGVELRVIGSDVSDSALSRAREGRYSELAIRHVEEPLRARWLEPVIGGFRVVGALRDRVSFVQHNLRDAALRPPIAGARWDAILCRNVLIHWSEPYAVALVARLRGALREGGTLVLGAADALMTCATRSVRGELEISRMPTPSMPVDRASAARALESGTRPVSSVSLRAGDTRRAGLDALMRGNRALASRDHEAALSAYAAATEVEDASIAAEACLLAGVALRRSGEQEAALAALRRATFLDPGLWQAWWALASGYDALGLAGRARAARGAARAALEREPPRLLASDVTGIAGLDLDVETARALLAERGAHR